MTEFNPELIKALAYGDKEAQESIKDLPASIKIGLGMEVDKLREEENIVPMNSGFSLYEKKPSKYINDEEVVKAMADRMQREKEERERQAKIREEFIKEQVKAQIERARSGLPKR